MILTLKQNADPEEAKRELTRLGLWVTELQGAPAPQFVVHPHSRLVEKDDLLKIPAVASVAVNASKHPLLDNQPRTLKIGPTAIGAAVSPVLIAGPCSVESSEQIHSLAELLKPLGVTFLRGGAFKPRTSPYDFQGYREKALRWIRSAASAHGMGVVTEVLGAPEVELVAEFADLIQIGSRNMHNFALLQHVGKAGKPVLLKRGMAATVEEWFGAAEHCLANGVPAVVFCERGIRSFDPATRNVLDLGAVALLAHVHKLPVIVDPSHAAGRRDIIPALARGSLAAGAAGLMVEVHEDPGTALSDGPQALSIAEFRSVLTGQA